MNTGKPTGQRAGVARHDPAKIVPLRADEPGPLMVAAVLIVRADVDLRFTALAATLLNGGFLLGAS